MIGPRLILTAAHCVCKRRRATAEDLAMAPVGGREKPASGVITREKAIKGHTAMAIITASDCAQSVTVNTTTYDPTKPESKPDRITGVYEGVVQTPPGLEFLFERKYELWASPDLAVIFLDRDVEGIAPVRLADAEVREGDPITLVGYGLGDPPVDFGQRCSGESRVSHILTQETGNVEFVADPVRLEDGRSASHLHGGDSGGGCFKAKDAAVLVGVNGATSTNARGEISSYFTSVFSHKRWLEQQLEDARAGRHPPRRQPVVPASSGPGR